MLPFFPGLITGLSLIVAIGAQNAFVLRQGLTGRHVPPVILTCIAVDVTLILVGVAGIGTIAERAPLVLDLLRWGGVAYLTWFAVRSFRAAASPTGLDAGRASSVGRRSVITATLAVSLLNPHVYLDTMVMLGTIANQHGPVGRWAFAAGACAASVSWFTALGLGARKLSGRLSRPSTWRWIDASIGVVMLGLAAMLALGG